MQENVLGPAKTYKMGLSYRSARSLTIETVRGTGAIKRGFRAIERGMFPVAEPSVPLTRPSVPLTGALFTTV